MSGHSKWSTIKRKKEKTDGARAKVFTKIGRELAVAVREGGGADPSSNSKLRECIAKAKANNVPNENIERIIKKAAGSADGSSYESIVYEGYGPCGIAVIVETLTDNRNRTAGDIRHYFDKYGGNLGTQGCVSFMFTQKGLIVIEKEDNDEAKQRAMSLFRPMFQRYRLHIQRSTIPKQQRRCRSFLMFLTITMTSRTYITTGICRKNPMRTDKLI